RYRGTLVQGNRRRGRRADWHRHVAAGSRPRQARAFAQGANRQGDDMNCDDARILMHGHLDGELDLAADLEIQRHLEECPRCASEYAALRAMRTRLKDEEFRFEAPASLREKIRRAIPASSQSRSAPQRSSAYQAQRGPWMPSAIKFALPMAIGAMLALIIAPRTIGP